MPPAAKKPKSAAEESQTELREFKKKPPRLHIEVLCQDPTVKGLGLVGVTLAGERYLAAGPTTARVEVVDRDARTGELVHPPVQVRKDGKRFAIGAYRKRPASNYHFHQVNVWAIVNRTLALLEEPAMLGRPVPWASGRGRLVVMPHAGRGENAYYDRKAGALLFFSTPSPNSETGFVYTCLSHDIVTHELGHAVLDGLKPRYDEVSSAQAAGFHEYFGDALALAAALTFREVVVKAAGKAKRELDADFLDRIGEELGAAGSRGDRDYVRRFSERWTLTQLRENDNQSAHDHSQVLSGIFFDFLKYLYELKLDESGKRHGSLNGGVAVAALVNAARQATRTMLCALDYCPPVDPSFLHYAQAVLRADEIAFPGDERRIRAKLAALFVDRGIGEKASDLWVSGARPRNRDLYPYDIDSLAATSEAAYRFLDENRSVLGIPLRANFEVLRRYRTRKMAGNGHFPPREIVLEFVWSEDLRLADDAETFGTLSGGVLPLSCGGTLVLDLNGNVLHYVLVDGSEERRSRITKYIAGLVERGLIGLAGQGDASILAFRDDEHVHLLRTPMLRHEEKKRDPTPLPG